MKQPSNETALAAELMAAALPKFKAGPWAAASLASELCALGRQYKRLSERLSGGEETWGRYPEAGKRIERAEKRRSRIGDKMRELAYGSPFRLKIDFDAGLIAVASTQRRIHAGRTIEERTALQ